MRRCHNNLADSIRLPTESLTKVLMLQSQNMSNLTTFQGSDWLWHDKTGSLIAVPNTLTVLQSLSTISQQRPVAQIISEFTKGSQDKEARNVAHLGLSLLDGPHPSRRVAPDPPDTLRLDTLAQLMRELKSVNKRFVVDLRPRLASAMQERDQLKGKLHI